MSEAAIDFGSLVAIAKRAGEEILDVYEGEIAVETKADDSPLTEADRRANAVIVGALQLGYPDIPILSEESKHADYATRKGWGTFWLVDPLDGTKEFIKRNGEFTVNIALIAGGQPVAGVVHCPVGDVTYWTDGGGLSYRERGGVSEEIRKGDHYSELETVRVIGSRSHGSEEVDAFVRSLEEQGKTVDFRAAGSSLKFCRVAEGLADVYPRMGPTMEWDTAAAHAVAVNAGCRVLALPERAPLVYNKESLLNPWFIVE